MTQRKEKTGICKYVVIATVVAIQDVVKNGFHCMYYKFNNIKDKEQTLIIIHYTVTESVCSFAREVY